jgi:hypothetical protein
MEDKKILYVALALVGGIMVGYMTGGANISVQDQGAATLSSKVAQDSITDNPQLYKSQEISNGSETKLGAPCDFIFQSQPFIYPPGNNVSSGTISLGVLKFKLTNISTTCTLQLQRVGIVHTSRTGAFNFSDDIWLKDAGSLQVLNMDVTYDMASYDTVEISLDNFITGGLTLSPGQSKDVILYVGDIRETAIINEDYFSVGIENISMKSTSGPVVNHIIRTFSPVFHIQ